MTPTLVAPPLDDLIEKIDEVASLPDVALRVIEATNDETSSANALANVVQRDPGLCATVLRLVNSSAFGVRNRVTNIPRAIGLLGTRQIRNLAVTASLRNTFRDEGQIGTYRRAGLWKHLTSVGVGARLIALRVGLKAFEDVFLAGLLHDIGIVLEEQYLNGPFRKLVTSWDVKATLEDNERRVLGLTHTELGGRIAVKWQFPPAVVDAIRFHHRPEHADAEFQPIVCCVTAANMICTMKKITSVGENLVQPSTFAVRQLGFSRADLETLHADFDAELARHETLFNL